MYTPRAIFSRLFLHICPFVLSLYTLGRLVTLSGEISDQSPITCVNGHYSGLGQLGAADSARDISTQLRSHTSETYGERETRNQIH